MKSARCSVAVFMIIVLFLTGCSSGSGNEVYHVGILSGLGFFDDTIDGFKEGMEEIGYIEGENIVYDVQRSEFDIASYRSFLSEFIEDEVDLIFVFPTEASIEAKSMAEGTGIPVLFSNANIEDTNLVESIKHPGGDITGIRWPGPELALKRFEVMMELLPDVKIVLAPYQRGYPIVPSELRAVYPSADEVGVTMIEVPADNLAELDEELSLYFMPDKDIPDAIFCVPEPISTVPETLALFSEYASEYGVVVAGCPISDDSNSSVFTLLPVSREVGRQAAPIADKILSGEAAGKIPVASADTFMFINYGAAREMGLDVPEGLLSRADEIIR